jgi:predicted metalloprotease with PDZ domain
LKCFLVGASALLLAFGAGLAPAAAQDIRPEPAPPPVAAPRDVAYPGTIRLTVDVTDLDRRIFRVRETIPVAGPGPLTLLYPQWLPGNHAPRGPIDKLGGLTIRANGQLIPWRRDPVEMYAFHVDVPAGVQALELEFQQLTPTETDQGRVQVTPEIVNLQWEKALIYPAGHFAGRITVEPSVVLPAGWGYGAALDGPNRRTTPAGDVVTFAPTSLETLVDSPMFAGRHYKRVDLDPGGPGRPPVRLNIVADAAENLEIKPEQLRQHQALVAQADRLFGARHFDRYEFLLATSDRLGGIGLEHHRSSENGVDAHYFTDWARSVGDHDLLPHEYVHSWNGKHRRGADLWTPNYNVPMRNSFLWLYEGQTQYWGHVLAARSGLLTKEQGLEYLALYAAQFDNRPGRAWRTLLDTTNGPIVTARRPAAWASWFRTEDYYVEGLLVWLDADTLIRERSGGRKSLDDFARAFFGPSETAPGGRATVRTYTFDDVVAALNAVQPHDWAGFLNERLQSRGPGGPLDGLQRGGYRLVYAEEPTSVHKAAESSGGYVDLTYSLGMLVNKDGKLTGVLWDGPAFKGGLATGVVLVGVNDRTYSPDALKAAVTAAKGGSAPIRLTVRSGDRLRTVSIPYAGGLRYPRLERTSGPARLDAILTPRS